MSKSNHFFGHPLYDQLINLSDKEKVLELSRSKSGERYIKRFDAWTHLITMLYAVSSSVKSLHKPEEKSRPTNVGHTSHI